MSLSHRAAAILSRHARYFRKDAPMRCLSVNETAIALRPFIFAVHPDLFGRFPKEQAVNEDSLKRLNEHIGRLHSNGRIQPQTLTFFVRCDATSAVSTSDSQREMTASLRTCRPVRVQLMSQNIRDTVRAVLTSCNLPLDYFDTVSSAKRAAGMASAAYSAAAQTAGFSDSVRATIFERFYGVHAYDQSHIRQRRMARDTLTNWLRKNVDRGRQNALQVAPVRSEIKRLRETIITEMGVTDVQWESSWTLASYRTALRGLLRICRQHGKEFDIKGRTVIFGTELGVCIQGHIILRHDDFADSWVTMLKTLYQYDSIRCKIPAAESYLSTLLDNIVVARQPHQPIILAQDYLQQLRKLASNIDEEIRSGSNRIRVPVNGVQVVVDCLSGSLMVSQCGQILVPSSTPAFLILDFINAHAAEAREIYQHYLRTEKSRVETAERCYSALGLESLARDPNVTREQMESCCQRLLKLHKLSLIPVDLTSCHIKVAQFYSVMSDGDICIPWNFEDAV